LDAGKEKSHFQQKIIFLTIKYLGNFMKIFSLTKSCVSKLLLVVMLCLPISAMADNEIETFYKDPTYTHFIKSSETFKNIQTTQDPYAVSKVLIYSTLILHKHPEFSAKIVNDFATFDVHQQTIFYKSLVGAGFAKEANEITVKYQFKTETNSDLLNKIKNTQFLDSIKTRDELAFQAAIMDFCWVGFFATGDEQYIAKLVDYAKKHQDATTQDPHFIPMQAYYWSSGALAKQDPTIKAVLTKLNAPKAA